MIQNIMIKMEHFIIFYTMIINIMKKLKFILILFVLFSSVKVASQNQHKELKRFRVTNSFFKNNLKNTLMLEKSKKGKKHLGLWYDLHLIVVKKKFTSSYDISIFKAEYSDLENDFVTLRSIGYFYLKGELFVVKGEYVPTLFGRTSHVKNFSYMLKQPNDDDIIDVRFLDGFPEWNFNLSENGYLILVSGLIE